MKMDTVQIVSVVICILRGVEGTSLQFDPVEVWTSVCSLEHQLVDNTQAIGGIEPVLYSLDASDDGFSVDTKSGNVWISDRTHLPPSNKSYIVTKTAMDGSGSSAYLSLHINQTIYGVAETSLPKMLMFTVREIAPVGEEVGSLDKLNYFRPKMFHRAVIKKANPCGSYLPFNISQAGIIVVSKPLAFRNTICDIFIVNITVSDVVKTTNHSNCVQNVTHIAARITIAKSDCPSNWTYQLRKNIYLDISSPVVIHTPSIETCKDACSANTLSCNSFVYNVVMTTCTLMNETDIMEPQAVQRRMGSFFYRKYCETDKLPCYALRKLDSSIPPRTLLTPSTSTRLLLKLVDLWHPSGIEPDANIVLVAGLVSRIVRYTDTTQAKQPAIETYVQMYGQMMDLLLLKTQDKQRTCEVQIKLLESFDDLLESLAKRFVNGTLEVYTHVTTVIMEGLPINKMFQKYIHLANADITAINYKDDNTSETGTETEVIVMGTMSGITHQLYHANSTRNSDNTTENTAEHKHSNYAVQGPVVAVVLGSSKEVTGNVEVMLDIPHSTKSNVPGGRSCVFFHRPSDDSSVVEWRSDGCSVIGYNSSHTRCRCNHLTNFAVLMQLSEFQTADVHLASLDLLTVIGCCVSITSLVTTVSILIWLRLYTERYVLFMNLSVAIVLSQTVFLLGVGAVKIQVVCRLVAVLLHYLFLSVFALMLVQGLYLFHKVHLPLNTPISTRMFVGLGWGTPLAIVILSLSMNIAGYGTRTSCWLSTNGAIWAFVGPAVCIIVINMSLLVMILRSYMAVKNNAKKSELEQFKSTVRIALVLMPMLGLTWIIGVMAVNNDTVVFQYLFVIINSLQGLFLFLTHVIFNNDVRRALSRYRTRTLTMSDILSKDAAAVQGPLHRRS